MSAALPLPENPTPEELFTRTMFPADGPRVIVEIITPQQAVELLKRNVRNRHLSQPLIAKYARDMLAGRWVCTGAPIVIGANGVLLDGQHRLYGIVLAGVPVQTAVAYGVDPDAQFVMDTGRVRSTADALVLEDTKNAQQLAAVARTALAVNAKGSVRQFTATTTEIREFITANPDLHEAVEFSGKVYRQAGMPRSIVGYTTWRMARIDQEQAIQFWTDVVEKIGLEQGDPILALIARVRDRTEKIRHEALISGIFRVWNARRAGSRFTKLLLTKAGQPVAMVDPR